MKISKRRLQEIILEEMESLSKENLNELGTEPNIDQVMESIRSIAK